MSVYNNIVEIATNRGTSISKIEKKAGLANGTIGKWKSGKTMPRVKTIQKISEVLGVSINKLIKEKEDAKSLSYEKSKT